MTMVCILCTVSAWAHVHDEYLELELIYHTRKLDTSRRTAHFHCSRMRRSGMGHDIGRVRHVKLNDFTGSD